MTWYRRWWFASLIGLIFWLFVAIPTFVECWQTATFLCLLEVSLPYLVGEQVIALAIWAILTRKERSRLRVERKAAKKQIEQEERDVKARAHVEELRRNRVEAYLKGFKELTTVSFPEYATNVSEVHKIMVYYLNAAKELRSTDKRQFQEMMLALKREDQPQCWLVRVVYDYTAYLSGCFDLEAYAFGWNRFDRYWELRRAENGWFIEDIDHDTIGVDLNRDNPDEDIREILLFVEIYHTAAKAELTEIKKFGVPALKKSKDAMGHSESLHTLRCMIQAPGAIFSKGLHLDPSQIDDPETGTPCVR